MTEVRTIRHSEADTFLKVLCDVFGITFERVRNVFYGEPFFDLERKWALFEDGEMVSILSTTPLQFGWGKASGIAGVATIEHARGRGFAKELIQASAKQCFAQGERAMFLFAENPLLYRGAGFAVLDDVVKAPLESQIGSDAHVLSVDEVQTRYDAWASQNDNRLRRDERRWRYWKWNIRLCFEMGLGYVCQEGSLVREAVPDGSPWPSSEPCHWAGLRSMAEQLAAPIANPETTTHLMGLGVENAPQLFLTDQW